MPNFEKPNTDETPTPDEEGVATPEGEKGVEQILQKMKDRLKEMDPDGVTPPEEYPTIGEVKD